MFLGKGVLKICSKFTGEHPCRSVISIKLQKIKIRSCLKKKNVYSAWKIDFLLKIDDFDINVIILLLHIIEENHFTRSKSKFTRI